MIRKIFSFVIVLGLVGGSVACGAAGDTKAPELSVGSDQSENQIEEEPDSDTEPPLENQIEEEQTVKYETWFPGVYLPRHCESGVTVNDAGFVIPEKDEIWACSEGTDNKLAVDMRFGELVRQQDSSEDVYGVSQYLRVFQMMDVNPTTGQFGLWGQWIGDDRAHPHGPFNSIEGGLFIADKMGRSKFPKYMASAATHLYSGKSDTGGGWGFYERRIDCSLLGRVTLSNRMMVPPHLISFDEEQKTFDDEGGIHVGTSWSALPIFGGKSRVDEQAWGDDVGKLTWTFIIDAANYSGPLIAYVPEHWSRRVDRFNALEVLDDVYGWDDSPIANVLVDFVNGDISNSQLHAAISEEPWYQVEPGSDGWEEGSYWVRPEQTLGLSPARPYLPTGNEMPEIPSFIETDAEGRKFAKIFPPLFPKKNDIEPFVSNAQTFDVRLYNHFVDIFNPDADLKTENTNFGDFGMPMHIEHNNHLYERENAGVFSFDEGDEREHPFTNTESFEIRIPLRPQHTNGETSIVIDWGGAEVEERGWSTYYEILDDNTLIPVSASEVPETLTELHYGSVPETANIAPHEIDASLGSDRENWVDPDFSCYDCEDMSVCDPKVYETVLDDESTVSYQWFRFRDQPLFQGLTIDYPDVYTDAYLGEMQMLIEKMHRDWGGSQKFLEQPQSNDQGYPLHLAEIDHGLLVDPPEGKESGWVPIVIQVEHPDGEWIEDMVTRETPIGELWDTH